MRWRTAGPWKRSLLLGAVAGAALAALATAVVPLRTPEPAPRPAERVALSCALPAPRPGAGGELRIHAVGSTLPASLRDDLLAGADTALTLWREWLDEAALSAAPATLLFLADAGDFAALYNGPDVDGWTATGFYRIRSHEAVILYAAPYRRNARATAFHELSHLMSAWYLGPTPPWLNEGLAEHFETFRPRGVSGFASNRAHLAVLDREGALPLDVLLSLSRRQFTVEEAARRYASAWGLIAFLLDSAPGRRLLTELLQTLYAGRCEDRDTQEVQRRVFDAYPGGATALAGAWQAWLAGAIADLPRDADGRAANAVSDR